MSNLAQQISEALSMFARNGTEPALIGGLNDATRTRDLDDICALLKLHQAALNMDELREYFALFNKPDLLHDLLR